MKAIHTKLTISLLLGLITFAFVYIPSTSKYKGTTEPVMPQAQNEQSLFGATDSWQDITDNYADYDEIGLNVWHTYMRDDTDNNGRKTPRTGVTGNDRLYTDVSEYSAEMIQKISQINSHGNSRLLWTRPKIDWLCYGQSSSYQCEEIGSSDDEWFYAFNEHNAGSNYQDITQYGSNQWVRHCEVNQNQTDGGAGWVVKRLRANTEQSNNSNHWSADGRCDWYIKPRIRIDSTVAHSIQNPLVCNIKVIAENGTTVLKNVD